jgi:hypothetical protein
MGEGIRFFKPDSMFRLLCFELQGQKNRIGKENPI